MSCALPIVVAAVAIGGGGDDWPGYRGPTHDGHAPSERLLDDWPAAGPIVRWSRELGQGYSGLCVVGERAFTQYQTVYGQYLICLDTRTGRTVWETRSANPYEPLGIYPGPRSTPAFQGGRVYGCTPDAEVFCLAADSGHSVWRVDLHAVFRGEGTGFGYSASPLVFQGKVILPVGGKGAAVVALDAATGKVVWQTGDDSASYCTMLPIRLENHDLIAAYLENTLLVIDLQTGRILWRHGLSSGYDEHSAQPLYAEPFLLISSPFRGGAQQFRLTLVADEQGQPQKVEARETWHSQLLSNDVVSSVLLDDAVFGFDLKDAQSKAHRPSRGLFRCLDWKTGKELWHSDKVGQASAIVADGKLVLFNDRGELLLARADREKYTEIGRAMLFPDEVCWTAPALSRGCVYLRSHTRAMCVDLSLETASLAVDPSAPAQPAGVSASQLDTRPAFNWNWVLNGEREHPFMLATRDDLTRWFVVSFVAAVVPALAAPWLIRGRRDRDRQAVLRAAVFAAVCCVLGIAATPVANSLQDEFVFTWPAAIFAILMLAVVMSTRLGLTAPPGHTPHRLARMAGLLFVLAAAGYFLALRRFSLPHEWIFLLGTVPAAPAAIVISRDLLRHGWGLRTTLLVAAAFALFFWSCGAVVLARAALMK